MAKKPYVRSDGRAQRQVGETFSRGKTIYHVARIEPYQRSDGATSVLVFWRARCAECGELFEEPRAAASLPGNRRCGMHRKPGVRAEKKRGKKKWLQKKREAQPPWPVMELVPAKPKADPPPEPKPAPLAAAPSPQSPAKESPTAPVAPRRARLTAAFLLDD